MSVNIDITTLNTILKKRYTDKNMSVIKNFLLEFVDDDINYVYEDVESFNNKTKYDISLIIENGVVVGIKIVYIPTQVLPDEDYYESINEYKACCRRVFFEDNGGFKTESCNIDFDICGLEKFNQQLQYRIEITQQCYDSSGIMISKRYGVKRQQLKRIKLSDLILISDTSSLNYDRYLQNQAAGISSYVGNKGDLVEYVLNLENCIININYDELFNEGFEILKYNLEDFSGVRVILLVECIRYSYDVAFIKILKGIYSVPSKFEAYLNLPDDFVIDLPDISFPKHLDHGQYDLNYLVIPKTLEEYVCDLERLVESGVIDKVQKDFFVRLCQVNSRDSLYSENYEYGTIRRFRKN